MHWDLREGFNAIPVTDSTPNGLIPSQSEGIKHIEFEENV
jgi:hypothetical protein